MARKAERSHDDLHGNAAGEYRIRVASQGADRLKAGGQYIEKDYANPNSRGLWYGLDDATVRRLFLQMQPAMS